MVRLGCRRQRLGARPCIHNRKELSMNKDQVKGALKEVKGEIEKKVGKATGNRRLEADGNIDQAAGKVQSGYGDLKDVIDKNA
jgi:uncharacterized protein YjbJ (UPF0337 family)